jgi:HEAT repeat protein
MTNAVEEIFASKMGHKEQVALLAGKCAGDGKALARLVEILKTGADAQKGTAAEVMKFVSKENPKAVVPYVDVLIECIDHPAPRVRWGCPESIGNLAAAYPQRAAKAVPKLRGNMKDKSTVVRWCAARALAEIAKHNCRERGALAAFFRKFIKAEKNSGVRNVLVKALKEIEGGKSNGSAAVGGRTGSRRKGW